MNEKNQKYFKDIKALTLIKQQEKTQFATQEDFIKELLKPLNE